jgi:hypothetical protein
LVLALGFLPGPAGGETGYIQDGLACPIGEVSGPIDAGDGSHYFVYVPTTLREGRRAPLLLYNGAGGGNADSVRKHIAGAELNGWIVAASVESQNGPGHPVQNHKHAKNCVRHLVQTLPIDSKRLYFTGGSGGGAMSFYNAGRMKAAGAMPHIGYIPAGVNARGGDYYVISGATDFNRYPSAHAVKSIGKRAVHRFFVGGHQEGSETLCTEGMVWLNGKYLAGQKADSALLDERKDYEAALIRWIETLRAGTAHRAYAWCVFLRDEYQIAGPQAALLTPLLKELAGQADCVKYVEGLAAIDAFSRKMYAPVGTGSKFKHVTPAIERAAQRLAADFAGVPEIEAIARELGKPTE